MLQLLRLSPKPSSGALLLDPIRDLRLPDPLTWRTTFKNFLPHLNPADSGTVREITEVLRTAYVCEFNVF